jgi:hypothetical protein
MKRAIKNIGLVAATIAAAVLVSSTANAAFDGYYTIGSSASLVNTVGSISPIPPTIGHWTYNKWGTGLGNNDQTGFMYLVNNAQIQLSGVGNNQPASGYVDFYIPLGPGDLGIQFTYTGGSQPPPTAIGWFSGPNYAYVLANPLTARHVLPSGGNIYRQILGSPGDVVGFYVYGDGTTTGANITIADLNPVPEPAMMLLNGVILLAGGAIGWVYRRRTAKA